MNNTITLLEKLADTIGIDLESYPQPWIKYWNPLEDDALAFQLQATYGVRLKELPDDKMLVGSRNSIYDYVIHTVPNGSITSVYRRAIVVAILLGDKLTKRNVDIIM